MAEPSNSFFSQKAMDKMRSPDDLNQSLRVASPRFWAVLCACAVFLAGFLIWGFFGTVSTTVSVSGVRIGDRIRCFLTDAEASEVDPGDSAGVNGNRMTVLEVSGVPLSREEARGILQSDYLADTLLKGKWSYHVTVGGDGVSRIQEGVPVQVHIVTRSMPPIRLILGGED